MFCGVFIKDCVRQPTFRRHCRHSPTSEQVARFGAWFGVPQHWIARADRMGYNGGVQTQTTP